MKSISLYIGKADNILNKLFSEVKSALVENESEYRLLKFTFNEAVNIKYRNSIFAVSKLFISGGSIEFEFEVKCGESTIYIPFYIPFYILLDYDNVGALLKIAKFLEERNYTCEVKK